MDAALSKSPRSKSPSITILKVPDYSRAIQHLQEQDNTIPPGWYCIKQLASMFKYSLGGMGCKLRVLQDQGLIKGKNLIIPDSTGRNRRNNFFELEAIKKAYEQAKKEKTEDWLTLEEIAEKYKLNYHTAKQAISNSSIHVRKKRIKMVLGEGSSYKIYFKKDIVQIFEKQRIQSIDPPNDFLNTKQLACLYKRHPRYLQNILTPLAKKGKIRSLFIKRGTARIRYYNIQDVRRYKKLE